MVLDPQISTFVDTQYKYNIHHVFLTFKQNAPGACLLGNVDECNQSLDLKHKHHVCSLSKSLGSKQNEKLN